MFAKGLHNHTGEDAGGSRGAGVSQSQKQGERKVEWRDSLVSSIQTAIFPVICKNALHQSLKLFINQSGLLIISVSAEEIAK